MSLPYDDTEESETDLMKALAFTPPVAPFQGTDRYDVVTCLGEGGFGVVYEVEDRGTGRRLALKTLKPQHTGFAANIRRLKREFRSVADLVHSNLVGLHELTSHSQRWFFTMDLVRGCDFRQYVRPGDVLDERRLRGALAQLVAGVAALHQAGVLHRDLKPTNVLVEQNGHVVILDFGLSGDDVEPALYLAGTPSFMSPEQIAGQAVTAASDWYSVGVMLHDALTGVLPHAGTDALAGVRVADDLRQLCAALLRTEAAERPRAHEIRARLGEQVDPIETRSEGTHFVGRTRELAELRAAFATMRDATTRVVRIHGDPGVGKSSLLARFRAQLPGEALVLASRCHERESVPFKAFDGVVDALVSHLQGLSRSELTVLLPRDIGLATQLFPMLGGVDLIRTMPRSAAPADPAELRVRSFRALKELLAALAAEHPLVIVIDDLQWGDIDSARLLLHVLTPPQARMLVVLAYRRDDATANNTLRETLRLLDAAGISCDTIAVAPLPEPDARELAELLIATDADAAREIATRGEGHPLFMAELAHGFARRETLDAIPSLIDMLWHRVGRLTAGARALVETVAVAGGPLRLEVSCAAANLGAEAVDIVRQLRAEHLLRAGDGELNVFHDRIRDAVTARVEVGARKQRHLALAHALERVVEPDFEALARHFDEAGEREPAGRYALFAANAAMNALAFDKAAALYQLAIDRGSDSVAVYQQLGDAWLAAGASAAGGRAYLEAAQRCDGPRAIELLSIAGRELCCAGDFATGEAALAKALAAVGERPPGNIKISPIAGFYHLTRMRMRGFRAGTPRRAADLLRLEVLDRAAYGYGYGGVARSLGLMMRAGRRGLESGEPRHVGRGLVMAAFGMGTSGTDRPRIADELLARASAIGQELGEPEIEALALRVRGETSFLYGYLTDALQLCGEAAAMIQERCRGMGFHRRFTSMVQARAALLLGEPQRCRAILDWLLPEAIDREDPVCVDGVRIALVAALDMLADRPAVAQRALDLASKDDRCGNVMFRAESEATLAMYRGDARTAVERWQCHIPRIKHDGLLYVPGFRLMAVRSLCAALLAEPSRRDIARAKRAARPMRKWKFPAAVAACAGVQANLAILDGDRDAVRVHLERVVEHNTAAGFRLDAGAARFARARLLGEDTEPVEAELRGYGVVSPQKWAAAWYPRIVAG